MRNKAFLLSLGMTGILALALVTRSSDILLIDVFFVLYLLVGALRLPAREDIRLTAERTVVRETGPDVSRAAVTVTVSNRGKKSVCLNLCDRKHESVEIVEGSGRLCARLAPGGRARLEYVIQARRGGVAWATLPVTVTDPSGCFGWTLELEARAEVLFHPRYARWRAFPTYPRRMISSPGLIPTRRSGHSTDFFGIREYVPGDPVRKLDWKSTARHPHKYFVREFEQENNAEMGLIVDGRRAMDARTGGRSVFEREVELAASLADMLIRRGNRVGLSMAGGNRVNVPPGYGKRQLRKILDGLARANPHDGDDSSLLHTLPIRQYSYKAQLFFISPFDYDDLSYYRDLRSRGMQVVLVSPDCLFSARVDGPSAAVRDLSLTFSRLERSFNLHLVNRLGVPVIDWNPAEPVFPLLCTALRNAGRIRKAFP